MESFVKNFLFGRTCNPFIQKVSRHLPDVFQLTKRRLTSFQCMVQLRFVICLLSLQLFIEVTKPFDAYEKLRVFCLKFCYPRLLLSKPSLKFVLFLFYEEGQTFQTLGCLDITISE